jgi:hypothetical protein
VTNPKTNPTKSQVVGALSSAGSERLPYTQEVRGSNPLAPTEVTGSPTSTYKLVGPLPFEITGLLSLP